MTFWRFVKKPAQVHLELFARIIVAISVAWTFGVRAVLRSTERRDLLASIRFPRLHVLLDRIHTDRTLQHLRFPFRSP